MAVVDSYASAQNYKLYLYSYQTSAGQSFSGQTDYLSTATFRLISAGTVSGTVTARLFSHSGTYGTSSVPNTLLAESDPIAAGAIGTTVGNYTFTFSGVNRYKMAAGTKYCMVVTNTGGTDASNSLAVWGDNTTLGAAGNAVSQGSGGANSWNASSGIDIEFTINGAPFKYNTTAGTDDARETIAGGAVTTTETGVTISGSSDVGIRFPSVELNKDQGIKSAKLRMNLQNFTGLGTLDHVTVYGEFAGNSAAYSTTASSISSRSRTNASIAPNTLGDNDTQFTTNGVDVTALVRDVIHHASWVSGNALSILFIGDGTAGHSVQFYAWDYFSGNQPLTLEITLSDGTNLLIDQFNTFNSTLWTGYGTYTATGVLALTSAAGAAHNSGISSNLPYDLTGNSVSIQVVDAGNQALTSLEAVPLKIYDAPTGMSGVFWTISGGLLRAKKMIGGFTQLASVTYNATTHKYLQIRESLGTTYFEYSSDRVNWTALTSITNISGMILTNCQIILEMSTGSAEASSTTTQYENLDISLTTTTQNVTGKARITASTSRLQTGKAAVKQTTLRTVTGKARIGLVTTRVQAGKANVNSAVVRLQLGKANVRNNMQHDIAGVASIRLTAPKLQTGRARLSQIRNQTQAGKARITFTAVRPITGTGRISNKVFRSLTGVARIATKPVFGDKRFEYKIYDNAGVYLGNISRDVSSDFDNDQEINSAGSSIAIKLARPADDYSESKIVAFTNEVRVYVHDQDAPNGVLVFRGEMVNYKPVFSPSGEYVDVTVMGYGHSFSNYFLVDGTGNTTVAYNSVDPSTALRDAMDKYNTQGGKITYTTATIPLTGTTISYTFKTATMQEVLDKVLELAPQGWYYYVDQATNVLYFQQKTGSPDHTFVLGKHIQSLSIEKRIEDIINVVFFTGGDTGGGTNLFKKYTNSTSVGLYGYRAAKKSDGRVTVVATADTLGQIVLDTNSSPELRTELVILDNAVNPSKGYDLEVIKLGQMIRIYGTQTGASGSTLWDVMQWDIDYWDYSVANISSLVLQVTKLKYNGNKVTLSLSTVPPDVNKRIEDLNRNLDALQTAHNPAAPS